MSDAPHKIITTETYPIPPLDTTVGKLLGLCRMMFLKVEATQATPESGWNVTVTPITSWPGDYYGRQDEIRSFGVLGGHAPWVTLESAISQSVAMCFGSLRDSCAQWRRCVKDHVDLRSWFKEREDG